MKKLLLLLLLACAEEQVIDPVGCVTAVSKTTHEVVFLRRQTLKEFNSTKIRVLQWDTTDSLYYAYRWYPCDSN